MKIQRMLSSEQKASYNYLDSEDQNEEVLTTDDDFVTDARTFLS